MQFCLLAEVDAVYALSVVFAFNSLAVEDPLHVLVPLLPDLCPVAQFWAAGVKHPVVAQQMLQFTSTTPHPRG